MGLAPLLAFFELSSCSLRTLIINLDINKVYSLINLLDISKSYKAGHIPDNIYYSLRRQNISNYQESPQDYKLRIARGQLPRAHVIRPISTDILFPSSFHMFYPSHNI